MNTSAIEAATHRVRQWVERLTAQLAHHAASGDRAALADWVGQAFVDDGFWRDFVTFTWNIRTLEGHDAITSMLADCAPHTAPSDWQITEVSEPAENITEAWLRFSTAAGAAIAVLRLRGERCWTFFSTLESLRGHEEKAGSRRELGTVHGAIPGRKSWLERREQHAAEFGVSQQPWCLIVGGGQGGLALGARLKRLGVPTLIIDRHARPGDSWRKRYRSLCLHDPVWYDHMPYLPFPDHWPVFTPKDKMGEWLEMYTRVMELDFWGNSECRSAEYDETRGRWQVRLQREGREFTLEPAQLVLATGMSGVPQMPELAGREHFRGQIVHSSQYEGGAQWAGKRCVVVGSNNSAHDICADLWEHGAQVTMLQRSPTIVVRADSLQEFARKKLYSEEALAAGITTNKADLIAASWPHRLMPQMTRPIYQAIAAHDADFYTALERAGFMTHMGHDGTGIHVAYFRRGSGYYIDVGASQLIIDGQIALRSPAQVKQLDSDAVVLETGERLPADLLVCATGYGSMTGWAEQLIAPGIGERLGPCWGLGSDTPLDPGPWEGELRNMWKPTAQPGLWFQGGNLMQARFFSLPLALQLKARFEGLATPVYR